MGVGSAKLPRTRWLVSEKVAMSIGPVAAASAAGARVSCRLKGAVAASGLGSVS